jgi:hypothetical protein
VPARKALRRALDQLRRKGLVRKQDRKRRIRAVRVAQEPRPMTWRTLTAAKIKEQKRGAQLMEEYNCFAVDGRSCPKERTAQH